MKSNILFAVRLSAVALVVGISTFLLTAYTSVHESTPFEVDQTTTVKAFDAANRGATYATKIARRHDGAKLDRHVVAGDNGKSCEVDLMVLPYERQKVSVTRCIGKRSTIPVPAEAIAIRPDDPKGDCAYLYSGLENFQYLGEAKLFGVKVKKYRGDTSEEIFEIAMAPALGCAALEERHHWKSQKAPGTFDGETITTTTRIEIGAVNERLFDIDAGVAEAKPSARRLEERKYLGLDVPIAQCWNNTGIRADAQYERARKKFGM